MKLADAYLGNRCQRGADLVSDEHVEENTLFHMIEVRRR